MRVVQLVGKESKNLIDVLHFLEIRNGPSEILATVFDYDNEYIYIEVSIDDDTLKQMKLERKYLMSSLTAPEIAKKAIEVVGC